MLSNTPAAHQGPMAKGNCGSSSPVKTLIGCGCIRSANGTYAANPQQDETQDKAIRFKRMLSFTLPLGCYATVLLRALGH